MIRYFDEQNNRLIYVGQPATPAFWDTRWNECEALQKRLPVVTRSDIPKVTKKYLRVEAGAILEGGCGRGDHVAALVSHGYQSIGIDFASETVAAVNEAMPELDVRLGDVRKLDFEDGYFAGYWSLGVIEHFWDGYQEIGLEMARVIQHGGYLFLTFPYMSRLRRFNAWRRTYRNYDGLGESPEGFYQFALDHKSVISNFESWGFRLVRVKPLGGVLGLKSEVRLLKPAFQKLYDYRGSSVLIRGFRRILRDMLTPFAGHTVLLVLRRL